MLCSSLCLNRVVMGLTLICLIMQNETNRGCNFFRWVEPEFCVCGDRVMSMLLAWQSDLKFERAMEVLKCKIQLVEYKSKIEVDATNFALKLERVENKYRSMQLKFQVVVACCWCLVVVLMCFPYCNGFASRLMLSN
jgi:hypothetical protein